MARLGEWLNGPDAPKSVHAALSLVGQALAEFKASPLYEKNCCQVILTGFVEKKHVIVLIEADTKGHLKISQPRDFAAIGAGATISTVLLSCRGHNHRMSVEETAYLVYEAKRFSEKADGIGPSTTMCEQYPGYEENKPANARLKVLSNQGQSALEKLYQISGLKQRVAVIRLPTDLFAVPKALLRPESTKADSSPPLPSPESPGGSGES